MKKRILISGGTLTILLCLAYLLITLSSSDTISIQTAKGRAVKQALPNKGEVSTTTVQEIANWQSAVIREELHPQLLESPKLADGSNSNLVIHNPRFSSTGDKYIAETLLNGRPVGLWLVSLSKGIDKQLVQDQSVYYSWSYDEQHIVYSPLPAPSQEPSKPPIAQSVYLMNPESGETKEIGQTTLGWNIESASTGDIAFLNGDTIHIVNPLTGYEEQIPSALTLGHQPQAISTDIPVQTPEKLPDIFLTPPAPLLPNPTEADRFPDVLSPALDSNQDEQNFECVAPACEVRIRISPDGKRLALQQIVYRDSTLVIVDLHTKKSIIITNLIGDSWFPFGWSPDSGQLAYAIIPEKAQMPELWIVNADGENARQISEANDRRGFYDFVTWLPNQKDILFIFRPLGGTNSNERSETQVISAAGSKPFTLFTGNEMLQTTQSGNRVFLNGVSMQGDLPSYNTWIADLNY